MPRPNATVATQILAFPLKNCVKMREMVRLGRRHSKRKRPETYLALRLFPLTGPHSTVVHDDFAAYRGCLDVFSYDLSVNLTPHVHNHTALREASSRQPVLGTRYARMRTRSQKSNQLNSSSENEELSFRLEAKAVPLPVRTAFSRSS